jgi:hypothetical protein
MNLQDALKAAVTTFLSFSWIALAIAFLPTLIVVVAAETRRWQYGIAGMLGGIAGEFCGIGSLFLSFWFACGNKAYVCNTAQGDMGLIITIPLGSFIGCLLALSWTNLSLKIPEDSPWSSVCRYSGPSRIRNWTYAIAIQGAFWASVTCLLARIMA